MNEPSMSPAKFEPALFEPALRATAALTRLDERLRTSPVREGYLARMAFHDAAASMWLGGELVHLEDLVLHDAHMDIRAPTHELTLAHEVLRAIRQVAVNTPEWALSVAGLQSLRGLKPVTAPQEASTETRTVRLSRDNANDDFSDSVLDEEAVTPATLELDRQLAEMDAKLNRLGRVLEGRNPQGMAAAEKMHQHGYNVFAGDAGLSANGWSPLIYDDDDDAEEQLSEWQTRLTATRDLPQVLRAALALDDWNRNEILPRTPWLGSLLAASMLRAESKQSGKASGQGITHVPVLFMGLRAIPRERRNTKDQTERLIALLEAFEHSALIGLKEHDRLVLARTQMQRKLKGKRASSKLPELIELVLSRPLVTSTMIERELKVTMQGALNLVAELGLREVTGRGRYRAWGVM